MSRNRYDADDPWRMAETPERHAYDRRDEQRRGAEPLDAREGDGWSRHGSNDVRNSFSARHRSKDPDRGHSAHPQQDPARWTPRRHEDRTRSYSREGRSSQQGGQSRHENDLRDDRGDTSRGDWQRDNGWESRRPASASRSWDDPPRQWSSGQGEPSNREDRAWEPAATWQSTQYGDRSEGNDRSRNAYSKSKSKGKGGKKNGSNNYTNSSNGSRQKRSWRDDDSQLNNWTRRDVPSSKKSAPPSTGKRRHRGSVSPGHSRSPESHHSRRSYRSRSRSIDTPKRRRRDDSLPRGGRSPAYSSSQRGREPRREGRYSRSPPSSISSRGRGRRRSLSSVSSYSRSRSRSPTQSPRDRPKAKHRLPPATHVKDISLPKGGYRNGQSRNRKGGNISKNGNGKLSETPFATPKVIIAVRRWAPRRGGGVVQFGRG
ncbi:hypothetical protein BC628DRAFT_1335561 [Trametes gibbosa]|nr:hypothetical protein BC628DRAFT_1335561 [Trametes gibbosa]